VLDIFPHKLKVTTDVLIMSKQLRKYYEYFKIIIGGKNLSNNLNVPMGALLMIPLDFLLMWVLPLQHNHTDESRESDSKLFFRNTQFIYKSKR
jgi:hypothetical protein